ncbi:MAG TPA: RDD family protein [Acidimicrobiales bacterium]
MSAYQFPAATPARPQAPSGDPTAVMGRRTGAWVVDFLLFMLVAMFVGPSPLSPLAEYVDTDEFPGITCEVIESGNDVSTCLEFGDRLYFTEGGDAAIALLVLWVAFPLVYAAVQGATGASPGKALFGVRVVDEQGNHPGFGRSLGRTALWIVDLAPWIIPGLVGFIVGLTSKGHRRVGDMAAKTFVVSKAHSGPVVVPGLTPAAPGHGPSSQPWGAPPPGAHAGGPPGWGALPQGSPPGGAGAPAPGAYSPAGPAPGGAEHRPAPPSGWAPPGGAAPSPATGTPVPSGRTAPSGPADTRPEPPGAGAGSGPSPTPPGAGTTPSGQAPGDREQPGGDGAPADRPSSADRPGVDAPAGGGAPQPSPAASSGGQAAQASYNPQWDAARGTYIVWEPNRGTWLGWDEAAQEWKPL